MPLMTDLSSTQFVGTVVNELLQMIHKPSAMRRDDPPTGIRQAWVMYDTHR